MTATMHMARPAPSTVPQHASIGDAIASWAAAQPGQPAFVDADGVISWRRLQGSVDAIGDALSGCGLGPGHRVGLVVPEGIAGGLLVLGVCCHCVLVPIHPALTAAEFVETAAQMRLDAIVVLRLPGDGEAGVASPPGVLRIEATVDRDGAPLLRRVGEPGIEPSPPSPLLADVALLLRSSGTTGVPKLVPVTHGNLLAMAAKMASPQWFGLGPADRAVATLPLYYAGGLKTLLLVPLLLGGSVAFPRPGCGVQPADWLSALRPTYLNTTPATLRAVLERAGAQLRGSSLRFVMCGASYLSEDLRQAAQAASGLPIVEYYGLSEAGVMAANPLPAAQARPGSAGCVIGDDLCVVDGAGRPAAVGEPGEILVRGATVCPGYVLADGSLSADARDGALATGDMGRIDADGFLWLLGRQKEVINRGGEKVFPYEVEKALLAHPDVLEAAVYAVPHARLGQGVAAAVVLEPGRHASPRDVTAWLAGRVAPFKVPRRLRVVAELPRGAGGKVLRAVLAAQHPPAAAPQQPADSLLQEELLALWQRLLGTDDVGVDDDFLESGGDSLLAEDLLLEVERLTGAPTQGWDLSTLTVNDVARAVLRTLAQGPAAAGDLLSPLRAGSGAPLVFCHGDIASRGIYAHRLFEAVATNHPVWLLHSPDRHAALDVEAVAAACVDEVAAVAGPPQGPGVYLAGWCNAGLVAWHLAHLLRARGVRVAGLLLVETPSLNGEGGLRRVAQALRGTGAWVPGAAGRFLRDEAMRGVWAVRRRGVPQVAAAATRRVNGSAPHETWVPDDLRRRSVLYYQRIARYVPPRLDVPVTCFVAEEGARSDTDPRRWGRLAPVVREVRVPGSHYSAVIGHRATLAVRLAECLQAAPAAHPCG